MLIKYKEELDKFINIRHNCASRKLKKVSNTEENRGYTNICCIAISKFYSGRVMLKNKCLLFRNLCQLIMQNWEVWIRSCRCGYFRDRILLPGQPLIYKEITTNRATPVSFLSVISFENCLVINNLY